MKVFIKLIAAIAAAGLFILGFQNCSQQKFSADGEIATQSALSSNEYNIVGGNQTDYGINGTLDSMDDLGVIEGTVIDPNQPVAGVTVDFYVVDDNGGTHQIGDVIATIDNTGGIDSNKPYNFSFQVPPTAEIGGKTVSLVCLPIVAYADINNSAQQLTEGDNFMLWGNKDECNRSSLPPMISILEPTQNVKTPLNNVTVIGRCQPGAGPVIGFVDGKQNAATDCNPNGTFIITVRITRKQKNHQIKIQQINNDDITHDKVFMAFLDQALPPPPPAPTPRNPGGGGGRGGGGW